MTKVANSRKDHRDSQMVRCSNHFGVIYGAAGLNECRRAMAHSFLQSIGKREESVGGDDGSLEGQNRFECAEADGVDAAHLAGAYTQSLARASIHDSI